MTARAITDLSNEQLGELVAELGGKPFQARQLAHWVFKHGASSPDECRNLPGALRDKLADWGSIRSTTVDTIDHAEDGTDKLLVRLADGDAVECVSIPEPDRHTLCVSTQVGCPVGCIFCASGLEGVRRNLTAGEIVEQVLHVRERLPEGTPLTNLVVMGMGEPLLNLDNLLAALERLHDPDGINLGARRITVSTSGYPERMARFAEVPHQYQLAVSLHAADDELRRELVPTARASVAEIVDAAAKFAETKGREVTFEVVLLAGVNDRPQDAEAMCDALAGVPCTVNLIAWNPVDSIPELRRPGRQRVDDFADALRRGHLKVTVRRQRGADQSAACGQLRLRHATT